MRVLRAYVKIKMYVARTWISTKIYGIYMWIVTPFFRNSHNFLGLSDFEELCSFSLWCHRTSGTIFWMAIKSPLYLLSIFLQVSVKMNSYFCTQVGWQKAAAHLTVAACFSVCLLFVFALMLTADCCVLLMLSLLPSCLLFWSRSSCFGPKWCREDGGSAPVLFFCYFFTSCCWCMFPLSLLIVVCCWSCCLLFFLNFLWRQGRQQPCMSRAAATMAGVLLPDMLPPPSFL